MMMDLVDLVLVVVVVVVQEEFEGNGIVLELPNLQ
jgi:hypothetical protein